ncbi:CDP-diacylglycerol--glycerol-3-phosphate 3-phosphatidyltransferase [Fictibacillus enclensis]|uniref:CDP-diacylglycerol--glycerol-3-phosphate 3-phosphatidyltransferase n=1 Tax=Fictibacillus TaxID=1329200 RepID=UPI001012471D|nr:MULTISPECIES: CDP-diacylglycerol--glycerol-3-phosphate 3-phosphatidyltransferase [Fictibacillus]MDM5198936.1 CDP-diacylglycerol--glycerol-3-phosphate 3-phosphatidyltransferase [Fictibacillus enclensis]MDM5338138.1 CDP-diacylglycerol--glycerol-3-phosphate 3-phosphatidyltransferase [Fictibacillus enclensis]RXY99208.1 CDP-diacylglycerol--glycerol-3-phosphate 3-phosphatidyltransferase [Fictibacillus sp. S7]WHY74481.1 CDP-diacylglycerol--glycerol-3-phosphate 3-phosphatidyltransferase [Fictibacill
MNLPNKITISRIFLIPVFMIVLLTGFEWGTVTWMGVDLPVTHLVAALIFIVASCTDWVDGYYARKLGLVTNFGKFLDPLADKLLVTAAFVALVQLGYAPAWMVIIILSREFAVTGIRLVAAAEGAVIAASQMGKLKTWIQIIAISALLLHNIPFAWIGIPFAQISMWAATLITLYSGWEYFIQNKEVMLKSK